MVLHRAFRARRLVAVDMIRHARQSVLGEMSESGSRRYVMQGYCTRCRASSMASNDQVMGTSVARMASRPTHTVAQGIHSRCNLCFTICMVSFLFLCLSVGVINWGVGYRYKGGCTWVEA